jgi:hypothetical protein
MKSLKVAPALLTLALAAHVAVAATEFEGSVPVDVALQFIGNPLGGQGKLYSDILDGFPPFTVPPGLTVIASADMGYLHRVILRSTLDAAAALDATTTALTAAGWSVVPQPGMGAAQVGFVSATPMPQYQQLCHDDLGMMTLSTSSGTGASYVNLNRNVNVPGMGQQPSCAQLLDPASQGGLDPRAMAMSGRMLSQYVPRLLMPQANNSTSAPYFGGGGGGGGMNDWEARGTLTSDWNIDEVVEHFVEQIEAQGWEQDSEVTGSVVATGSWTKTVDDMDLIGTLSILQQAENTWDLRFRVVRTGAESRAGTFGTIIRN